MGAAEPAVEPEQLDAVGLAAEHAFTRTGQPEANRAEAAAVAEGRRRRQRAGRRRLPPAGPPPPPSSASARKNQASPRNGASSSSCAAAKATAGVDAPAATASSARRSVPERPSPAAGSSSSRRSNAAREQLERPDVARERRERHGIGRSERCPRLASRGERVGGRLKPARPERLELVRAQLAEPAERRLARERRDEDQLRSASRPRPRARARRSAGAGRTGRARTRGRPGRPSRRASGSAAGRGARARSESRCASPSRSRRGMPLARPAAHGACTAGTGPSWRTSFQGSTAPPSEVARSVLPALSPFVTCSSVGRVAGSRPRGRDRPRRRCSGRASRTRIRPRVPARPASAAGPRCGCRSRRSSRPSGCAGSRRALGSARRTEVFADLGQGEADGLCLLDGPEEPHRVLVVAPVAAGLPVGRRQEPAALVVAERLHVHPRAPRELADFHRPTIDPYLGTGIKQTTRRPGEGRARAAPCRPSARSDPGSSTSTATVTPTSP